MMRCLSGGKEYITHRDKSPILPVPDHQPCTACAAHKNAHHVPSNLHDGPVERGAQHHVGINIEVERRFGRLWVVLQPRDRKKLQGSSCLRCREKVCPAHYECDRQRSRGTTYPGSTLRNTMRSCVGSRVKSPGWNPTSSSASTR
jgi:hypothetical protein